MREGLTAETITIRGFRDEEIEAYLSVPSQADPHGGVVVIHHMPGFDAATKEITRRFAANGYAAICPNLHYREAPGAAPDDAAAASRASGGVPDARLVGDVEAAMRRLLELPTANGKVGVIGYCSGGRQAFLAACSLPLDAAVDCYGAFILSAPPESSGLQLQPLGDLAPKLTCPLLGLFGAEDSYPSADEVNELESLLTANDKTIDFHVFDEAGHAFFATDRPTYRPEAANAGWRLIWQFFARELAG
jgi:carboxymethylenebutenolidase